MRLSFPSFFALTSIVFFVLQPFGAEAASLSSRLSGRILLQVQSHGEAWYIDPLSKTRFYLGTAEDAFQLLRMKGLGIRHAELERYLTTRFPTRLAGRILLDVDDRGQAYYILPQSLRAVRLGSAEETYQVLRQQGLGITTVDLERIMLAPNSLPPVTSPVFPILLPSTPGTAPTPVIPTASNELERRTHDLINQHRQSIGVAPLIWSDVVADSARTHSQNMGDGRVVFGHDGFDERYDEIRSRMRIIQMGENVASNTFAEDSVAAAVHAWIQSDGHRRNIENSVYTHAGIGVIKGRDEEYFFTQIFVK
jgi:uncharacterized protein YkwD